MERYAEQLIQEEKLKMLKKLYGNFRQLTVKTTVSGSHPHSARSHPHSARSRVVIERLAVNAKDTTVLASITASSATVGSEGRQIKQC